MRIKDEMNDLHRKFAVQESHEVQLTVCPNRHCEWLVGSIQRECTDHIIPISEIHLESVLREYQTYYNKTRTHYSLDKDAPEHRRVESRKDGAQIISIPHLGGLHHRYERQAA